MLIGGVTRNGDVLTLGPFDRTRGCVVLYVLILLWGGTSLVTCVPTGLC